LLETKGENIIQGDYYESGNEKKIHTESEVFSDVEDDYSNFIEKAFQEKQKGSNDIDSDVIGANISICKPISGDNDNGEQLKADLCSSIVTGVNQIGFDTLSDKNESHFEHDCDSEESNKDKGTEKNWTEIIRQSRVRRQGRKKIQKDQEAYENETTSPVGPNRINITKQESEHTHGLSKLKCIYCDRVFRLKSSLRIHLLEAHQQDELTYDKCDLSFKVSCQLDAHTNLKYKTQKNQVHDVVRVDRKMKKIRVEKMKSRLQTEKSWKCEPCGKEYKTESGLYFHNEAKHSGKQFTCEYCDAKFSLSMSLKCHMIEIHNTGKKGHACELCQKVFAYKSKLSNHMKVRHPTEEDKKSCMVCECCGKTYTAKIKLDYHLKKCGNRNRNFFCSECPYKAFTKTTLRYHIEAMHETERKYMCHICGKYLKNRFYMRTHLRIHSEDRNFPCEKCGKKFKLKTMLKRHENIHQNVKKFHCNICEKTFVQNNNLKAHMRQHTGEKPFKCDFCEKTFTHNISRKNHMLKCDVK
jgi:KRAB domain-containing zinc finger protein